MDDEFKFLLCERCQKEVKSPKLLSCLHNLCTECLEESKPNGLCKICGTPYSQNAGTSKQDNLLFANLQANLSIYWKAVDSKDLMCDNCKEGNKKAEYWCSVCKEFLCTSCYESHQKYTRESHEIRALKGIAAGSSKEYLDWIKKRSVNSCSIHKNEPVSRYCPECRQSMCSKCALLDSIHTGLHRDLQEEIKHGRDELQGMSMELMKKKSNYSGIYERLKKLVKDKEKVKSETKALQKMIEIMMQLVQERREALLTAVEQHNRDVQDVKEKMKHMEGMLERIKSSEQLVEKMHLYASDQEVMVMHPFIRESLEELKRKQPSTVDYKRENLTEVKTQIQALFERVTGEKAAPAISQKAFNQEMDDEFGFLLCEWCQRDVKNPKLLPCLHNLCTECLEENKAIGLCPICRTPHSQNAGTLKEDNVLFRNLQAKLSIYQKVSDGKDLTCNNCQREAEFWCFECSEFFCVSCFGFHQKLLKQDCHQAKSLKDLKAQSSKGFLDWIRKLSTSSCSSHKDQPLSRYCPECKQSMCLTCALLDNKHVGQHWEIQKAVKHRQDELQSMSTELKKKRSNYSDTIESLKSLVKDKEKGMNETKKLLQEMTDVIVRLVQENVKEIRRTVEKQHSQEVQDIKAKMEHMEGVLKRMKSSERLVEKMRLYALGQEVIDMHPFIRKSLEELKRKQPPAVDYKTETANLTEVKTQLQALFERVAGENEAAPAISQKTSNQGCSGKSPAKRKNGPQEKANQTPPKAMKTEPGDSKWKISAIQGSCSWTDQPGPSSSPVGGASNCTNACTEEENSDDEFLDANLLEDTNDNLDSSLAKATTYSFRSPMVLNSGLETLVFFDMKNLPGRIFHLAAIGDNSNRFVVTIQPQPFVERGDMRANLCEHGLDNFLSYLKTLHMPILVGYNLWSMDLPTLVNSLEAIRKEENFEASFLGFLDALPLIKQKIPDTRSYILKNLHRTYLSGQLDDTQPQDCVKTVMDLCTILGINQMMLGERVISYSSLRCYISLQPLLKEKLLSKTSAQTLALHNVDLSQLQLVYQDNPAFGLQRFCQALNSRLRSTEKKIKNLSKIRLHFQARSLANWLYSSPAMN
ncbi:protein PML-like isoform X2 [Tiliqua scincoides]|uniref:protein PML-like isoform X2 n=1 Tax=Tiliqua scincoides TaxID=71010 RepID=UPI003461BF9D